MSRISSGDVIQVKPSNDVYTGLAAVGFVLVLTGLILFIMKAQTILGDGVLFAM